MKRHIALIEDDSLILRNYVDFLTRFNFKVDAYSTKEDALNGIARCPPELIVLDVMLNGERDAGFVICSEIRRQTPLLPIIFLTSHDGEADKISGMRLGADDYLSKDISLDYLIVRIEALFRRIEAFTKLPQARTAPSSTQKPTEPVFDENSSTVTWMSQRVELTLTQFWILQELCSVPGQVRSHAELMRAAKTAVAPNTISAHIKAIREALLNIDPSFDRIRSERSRGYRWLSD
jgi:two-component system OmpR family response regulator